MLLNTAPTHGFVTHDTKKSEGNTKQNVTTLLGHNTTTALAKRKTTSHATTCMRKITAENTQGIS